MSAVLVGKAIVKSPPLTGEPPVRNDPVVCGVPGVATAAAADDELDELDELVAAVLAAAELELLELDPVDATDLLLPAELVPQASKTSPIAERDNPAANPRFTISRRDSRRLDTSSMSRNTRRSSSAIDLLRSRSPHDHTVKTRANYFAGLINSRRSAANRSRRIYST